jgi:hypothetical protein
MANHLDNKKFLELVLKYQELGEEMKRRDKNELGEIIVSLVNHLALRPNFCNYTYLEEMKSNGIICIWKGLKSFDVNKCNSPFTYFTKAAWRAFVFVINKEKMIFSRRTEFQQDIQERIDRKNPWKFAKKKYTQEFREKNTLFD